MDPCPTSFAEVFLEEAMWLSHVAVCAAWGGQTQAYAWTSMLVTAPLPHHTYKQQLVTCSQAVSLWHRVQSYRRYRCCSQADGFKLSMHGLGTVKEGW